MWTKEIPQKSGYYWIKYLKENNPTVICYRKGDKFLIDCLFWSEPLVPPTYP